MGYDYEKQGTGYDPHASGHELQGRSKPPSVGDVAYGIFAPPNEMREFARKDVDGTIWRGDRPIGGLDANELRLMVIDLIEVIDRTSAGRPR